MLSLTITHRGKPHSLTVSPDATLADLQAQIAELTDVPVQYQKLLYGKGKKKEADAAKDTLTEAGLKDGTKIMLLGSTVGEIEGMKAAEDEKARRDAIMAQRAARGPTKLSSRAPSTPITLDHFSHRFHRVAALPNLPDADKAEAFLQRLANDPAIKHVMQTHQFSVMLLTELEPREVIENPTLYGLNEGRGQVVKLRLRSNYPKAMLRYADVRKTLCHELAHNVWGGHDENFRALDRKLNEEVAEYERTHAVQAHHLDNEEYYEPALEADAYATMLGQGSYVLGGSRSSEGGESRESRRQNALEAAMRRLQVKEEEIERGCGSNGAGEST